MTGQDIKPVRDDSEEAIAPNEIPRQSLRQRVVAAAKWLWMVSAVAAFIGYFLQNQATITAEVQRLGWTITLLIALGILIGRLLLIWIACVPVLEHGIVISFQRMFVIFSVTDMAKYIPGGIWHFVGRASYYHDAGLSTRQTADSLLKENLWLAFTAGSAAGFWLILSLHGVTYFALSLTFILTLIILRLWVPSVPWRVMLGLWVVQFAMWAIYGASFALMLPTSDHFMLAMGAFILSWMIGFLTIFAPGGIGVREAVLVAVLAPVLPISTILIFAILHRFLWTLIELILGGLALLLMERDE